MKKLLLVSTLLVVPVLLVAQARQFPTQGPRPMGPGHPDWKGQTVQIGTPRPDADVGGLNPADIYKPLADEWRSYSGDLSGKRYSSLKHVNTATVKNLSLKWMATLNTGCGPAGMFQWPPAVLE